MHDHSLALATATSGMIGGVTRAVAEEMTLSTISMQGFLDVVFYATVSASVGYGVKRLWDAVTERREAAQAPAEVPKPKTPQVRSTVKPDEWQSQAPLLPKVQEQPEPTPPPAKPAKRRPGRPRKTSTTKPAAKPTPKNPSQS